MSAIDFEALIAQMDRIEAKLNLVMTQNALAVNEAQEEEPTHCLIKDVDKYAHCKGSSIYVWRSRHKKETGEDLPFIERKHGRDQVNIERLRLYLEERRTQRRKPKKSKITPLESVSSWRLNQARKRA